MRTSLSLLAISALLSACAAVPASLHALTGTGTPEVAANWQPDHPDFGFMSSFVNKRYMSGDMNWMPRLEDGGRTYVFDHFKLRNTPQPGVLQVIAKPAYECDKAHAVLERNDRLVITCVTWHNDYRTTITPNATGAFDLLTEVKLTDGLNFLQDYTHYRSYQAKPYTEAGYRQERAAAAAQRQWAEESARQAREDKRESDAATARAFGNAMATLGNAANQAAQYQAAQAAQAQAQAQARRESQMQAQREAAARQAQQAQQNARLATQRQEDIARQDKEQQARRLADADAARKAEAQAKQEAAARRRQDASRNQATLTLAQGRNASNDRTASQSGALPSRPSGSSTVSPLPTQNGKDLNCNTERQCFAGCAKGPKEGVFACQQACTARSTCKVSLQ